MTQLIQRSTEPVRATMKASFRAAIVLASAACCILALGNATPANAESTISCPTGTYDMLDWMTLDSSLAKQLSPGGNQQSAVHDIDARQREVLLGQGRTRLSLGHSTL